LRECPRAGFFQASLLLHTTCVRSCCNWRASGELCGGKTPKKKSRNPAPKTQDQARFSSPKFFQAEPRKMMWQCGKIVTFVSLFFFLFCFFFPWAPPFFFPFFLMFLLFVFVCLCVYLNMYVRAYLAIPCVSANDKVKHMKSNIKKVFDKKIDKIKWMWNT